MLDIARDLPPRNLIKVRDAKWSLYSSTMSAK
jgi:hypothetical protein